MQVKLEKTDEGIDVSMNLLNKGFVADDDIERFRESHTRRIHPGRVYGIIFVIRVRMPVRWAASV